VVSRLLITGTSGAKWPKVSGHSLKYSRFPETPAGDRVRSALPADRDSQKFSRAPDFRFMFRLSHKPEILPTITKQ